MPVKVTMEFRRTVPGKSANGRQFPDEFETLKLEVEVDTLDKVPNTVVRLSEAKFQATKLRIEKATSNSGQGQRTSSGPMADDDVPF